MGDPIPRPQYSADNPFAPTAPAPTTPATGETATAKPTYSADNPFAPAPAPFTPAAFGLHPEATTASAPVAGSLPIDGARAARDVTVAPTASPAMRVGVRREVPGVVSASLTRETRAGRPVRQDMSAPGTPTAAPAPSLDGVPTPSRNVGGAPSASSEYMRVMQHSPATAAPSTTAASDVTYVGDDTAPNRAHPSLEAALQAGLSDMAMPDPSTIAPKSKLGKAAYAVGSMAAHPLDTAAGMAAAPFQSAYTLGRFARQYAEQARGNAPGPKPVSRKDAAFAAGQLIAIGATEKILPMLDAVFGEEMARATVKAINEGRSPARALATGYAARTATHALAGSAVGATFSPDDPEVGAILGAALAGAHAASQTPHVSVSATELRQPVTESGALLRNPERPASASAKIDAGAGGGAASGPIEPDYEVTSLDAPVKASGSVQSDDLVRDQANKTVPVEQKPSNLPAPEQELATNLTPRPYVPQSSGLHATEEQLLTRNIARGLKTAHPDAIAHAAPEMAQRVPPNAVLVPLPDHTGSTAANAQLAQAMTDHVDADVADVLGRSAPTASSRDLRQKGKPGVTADEHEASLVRTGELPKGRPIVFVDNVETTGATAEGARRVLGRPDAQLVTYAKAPIPAGEEKATSARKAQPEAGSPAIVPSKEVERPTKTEQALAESDIRKRARALGYDEDAAVQLYRDELAGKSAPKQAPPAPATLQVNGSRGATDDNATAPTRSEADGDVDQRHAAAAVDEGGERSVSQPAVEAARTALADTASEAQPAAAQAHASKALAGRPHVPGPVGRTDQVHFSDGSAVQTRYRVIEADHLQPSHNPTSFAPNPEYPAGVQGREYSGSRGIAARQHVETQTGNLRTAPLLDAGGGTTDGPPVITPHGIAIAGNQRAMMVKRAIAAAPERYKAYRDELESRADSFGLDPEQVRGMTNPVLVRELADPKVNTNDVKTLSRLNQLSDQTPTKTKDALSDAMGRAKQMQHAGASLAHFNETIDPDQTIREYLSGSAGPSFVRKLVEDGVIAPQERGVFVDGHGAVTSSGKEAIEAMLRVAAIGDPDIIHRTPAAILRKLESAIPAIIQANGTKAYALTHDVQSALELLARVDAMKSDMQSRGEKIGHFGVADFLAQQDVFGNEVPAEVSDFATFLERTPKALVTATLREYTKHALAAEEASQSDDIFGEAPATKPDLTKRLVTPGESRNVGEPRQAYRAAKGTTPSVAGRIAPDVTGLLHDASESLASDDEAAPGPDEQDMADREDIRPKPSLRRPRSVVDKVNGEGQALWERKQQYSRDQLSLFKMNVDGKVSPASSAKPEAAIAHTAPQAAAAHALVKQLTAVGLPESSERRRGIEAAAEKGLIDPVGRYMRTAKESGELMKAFRHPAMEIVHAFVKDADGKVVGHIMRTSGTLNWAAVPKDFAAEIAALAKRVNGERVTLGHNHPSGDPTQSLDDMGLTAALANELAGDHGYEIDGHIIIDHDKATWIALNPSDRTFSVHTVAIDPDDAGWKTAAQAGAPKITSKAMAASYLSKATAPDALTVAYLDAQHRVVAVAPYVLDALHSAHEWLPEGMKAHAAHSAIIVTNQEQAHEMALKVGRAQRASVAAEHKWAYPILDVIGMSHDPDGVPTRSVSYNNEGRVEKVDPLVPADFQERTLRLQYGKSASRQVSDAGRPAADQSGRRLRTPGEAGRVQPNDGVTPPADAAREMAGGYGADLFGNASRDEEPQDSLFGAEAGTAKSRSLAETEAHARSEIARIKREMEMLTGKDMYGRPGTPAIQQRHAARRRQLAAELVPIEKLANRGKAISADEMQSRAAGGDLFGVGEQEAGYGAQTGTPEFKRWFGDSKVVDEKGEPLVVYHGTRAKDFDTFRVGSAQGWGAGIYFTDNGQQAAEEFGHDGRVVSAYVSIRNPYRDELIPDERLETTKAWQEVKDRFLEPSDAWQESGPFVGAVLRELGYDGIIAKGSNGINGLEIVAFRPEQIKSATDNSGAFNPKDPNILREAQSHYGHDLFGAKPVEDEPVTGVKNAVSALDRERLGMGPRRAPEPRTQEQMYAAGKAVADADPTAIARLLADLRDNSERIVGSKEEAGLLLKHRVDLDNKLKELIVAKDRAVKSSDAAAERLARLQLAEHREAIRDFVQLAERTGTATGRALAARKMMSTLDYSLSHMETMAEAAKGSALTRAELERIKALHEEIVAKLATTEKDLVDARERAANAEADLHHAELRAEAMKPLMTRVSSKLDTAADAARARIKARGLRAMAGMDPEELADHAIIGAAELAKGVNRFTDWSKSMKAALGDYVTPHLREIFDAANERLNTELKAAREVDAKEAEKAAKKQAAKEAKKNGISAPAPRGSSPDAIRAKLKARLDDGAAIGELRPYLRQLALDHIRRGITEREPLLDALYKDVLETGASVTRPQLRDALSGYGDSKPLDKAADKARLREIQAEAQKLAQLEALQKGEAPLASGFERPSPNDETRKLTKQVNEAKKAAGIGGMDDATRLKSALSAAKTRTRNAIADLRTEIDTGERIVAGKHVPIGDAELDALRNELKELRKIEADVFGKPGLTDEQRLQRATAAAKRTAEMWSERLEQARKGAFAPPGQRPRLSNPTLEALRAKAAAAREEYAELRALDPAQQAIDDAKANARYRTVLAKREAELLDRMARNDYTPKPLKPGTRFDRESLQRKADLEEVKQRYQDKLRQFEKANRTTGEKVRDAGLAFVRAGALSWPSVILKLTSVALSRTVTTPLTDLAALGVANALPDLAKGAPRYGTRSPRVALQAEAAAQAAMWTDGIVDAGRLLQNKQSRLTLLHGKHKLPHEWYEYFGSIHAALKEPIKRAEYARALYRGTVEAMERGENTTDDFVKLRLSTEAYLEAQRAVSMNDNVIVDAWNNGLRQLERKDKVTGKANPLGLFFATALRTEMPIVKAPTNVILDASEFIAGLPLGAARAAWGYANGLEDLKPVERDSIIRMMSKGMVGLAIMALYFYKHDRFEFGGFYQPGEKRKPDDVPADAARLGTKVIPKTWLHNPMFMAGQFAATIARVAPTRLRKRDEDPQGYGSALVAASVGLLDEIPLVGGLVGDVRRLSDPKQREEFLSKKVASLAVPGVVQWVAAKTDTSSVPRTPVGLKQHLEFNVPMLRQNVPVTEKARRQAERLSEQSGGEVSDRRLKFGKQ